MSDFVFHDPTGRRARQAALAGGLLLSLAAAVVAAFFATLALAPRLPNLQLKDPRVLSALHVENAHRLKGKPSWTRIPRRKRDVTGAVTKPLSVAFYVSWDERSRVSLNEHVNQIDVLAPTWVALKDSLGRIDVTDDPQAEVILAKATHKPSVLPVIHNAHNSVFDGPLADNLLLNPAARAALIHNLIVLANSRGYSGYVFDLENLSPAAKKLYPLLIAEANKALDPSGREVWVTAPFADNSAPLEQLQAASDTLVLMAFDQHWTAGDPGSPAGQDWFEQNLDKRLSTLDETKTILALGVYGYDWTLKDAQGRPCAGKNAEA